MNHLADGLANIDYVIIAVYMVGVLSVGFYFSKYVHSAGDLFLAGRSLPFWAIGMSIVVSDIGAIDLITGADAAYQRGIAQANFDWIGSMPALVLAAFIFVPYYWRAGVYTLPEFLGRRYNPATRWIHAIVLLIFMLATLSIVLWTSAVFLNNVLGWDYYVGIWSTAIVVGIYTVSGGLAAVVMTDVMQLVVMFVGTAALLVLALWEVGGLSGMVEKILVQPEINEDYFRLLLEHRAGHRISVAWDGLQSGDHHVDRLLRGQSSRDATGVGGPFGMGREGRHADRRPVQADDPRVGLLARHGRAGHHSRFGPRGGIGADVD